MNKLMLNALLIVAILASSPLSVYATEAAHSDYANNRFYQGTDIHIDFESVATIWVHPSNNTTIVIYYKGGNQYDSEKDRNIRGAEAVAIVSQFKLFMNAKKAHITTHGGINNL
ncbi:hypothetical protein [Aliikangiella coralliicola]|uniref:Uncharacterized protein n=1 Tax=Aliikangiella coralliicola TaxID=2592383 RepID=A0A545UFZ0_9GAMM|nr:hypothetical protein [Aliikangiella coralliicola]TQV88390.1 hypothetical protein FLL46_07660 [Aliikangiella coralliicola]